MSTSRTIVKEIGTAFAVLALYLLTILTPLHHARASQLDFAALGYQTLETGWALCSSVTDRGEGKSLVVKCPANGIGKQDLVEPSPAVLVFASVAPVAVAYAQLPHRRVEARLNLAASPRAPPALV